MATKKKPKTMSMPNESAKEEILESVVEEENEIVTDETPVEPIYGIVSGCNKLNIRKDPGVESPIVCIVDSGSKLSIDTTDSTDEWCKVYTETGFEGFCMKKFITIG